MSDIAVKVENLSKMYRLGIINNGTFFRDIQTWIALKRGKEDPHSKIGENKYNGDKDHFWALKDISFEIKQGDRVGIIGKNGAGKSTLLKLLSRISAPTEGVIKIKGKITSLLEVGTGFHGELTGRENIYLNGAILGMKKRQIDKKIDSIIDFSGIEHHIDTPVKRYSSGMYVRLAFAVAAHLDSDILIADEVLAVGDAEFQKKALGKMQDLSTGEGRTVFFVSHNLGAVKKLCNYCIILEKGRICKESKNVESLVFDYLNNFKNVVSHQCINKGEFFDYNFSPISLELQKEDGTPAEEISAENNYIIKFVFEIKKLSHIKIGFYFFSADGICLFGTYLTDYKETMPKEGINIRYCSLPKNFLCINKYIISLSVVIPNTKWIIDPYLYQFAIHINVIKKPNYHISEGNLVSPIVQWSC